MAEFHEPGFPAGASLDAEHLGVVGELFSVRLQRAEFHLRQAVNRAWKDQKLRTGTVGVLSQIEHDPGISQNEIARLFTMDKSAVNAIVNRLEGLGWAERRTAPGDLRRHALFITDAGREALHLFVARVKEIEARMLSRIPDDAIAQLRVLLDQLHASCLSAASELGD